jgi:hypothetical protein
VAISRKQQGVLQGMALGAAIAVSLVAVGILLNPFRFPAGLSIPGRISVASQSAGLLAICLAVAVGRLAAHRFFTPEDIDGGGLHRGSDRAILLQSLLQNTLEQAVLAALVYLAWAVTMPPSWLSVVPLAAICFAIGRILFFRGYSKGAPARALGFTMAFYPSLAMLVCMAVVAAASLGASGGP